MLDWLDGIAGPDYARAILWTFAALILFVIVLVIIKLIRSMTFGTFVAGGRNRKTRLGVMDATAIDSHRRLVLVRRDDVEHLLLIGGPTDVVVERDIRISGPRRPVPMGDSGPAVPAPKPQIAPAPAPVKQASSKPTPQEHAPSRAHEPSPRPSVAPIMPPATRNTPQAYPAAAQPNAHAAPAKLPEPDNIDDAFMSELDMSLDDFASEQPVQQQPSSKRASGSLDDEMAKLLGELSSHKK